jgi:hypothetical protein
MILVNRGYIKGTPLPSKSLKTYNLNFLHRSTGKQKHIIINDTNSEIYSKMN